MAQIISPASEAVYQIKKWLGVNEAQEGEASLKMGEAAVMRNFKVTDGGALKKRAGSRSIAGLMSGYTVEVDTGTTEVLLTEALATPASRRTPSAISRSRASPSPSATQTARAISAITTATKTAASTASPG